MDDIFSFFKVLIRECAGNSSVKKHLFEVLLELKKPCTQAGLSTLKLFNPRYIISWLLWRKIDENKEKATLSRSPNQCSHLEPSCHKVYRRHILFWVEMGRT